MSERTRGLRGLAALAGASIIALLALSGTAAGQSFSDAHPAAHVHADRHPAAAHVHATQWDPSAPSVAAAPAAAHYPVVLNEMSITTGWIFVPAGPVVLDIRNTGAVTHELVVIRTDTPPNQLPKRATDPSKVSEDGSIGEAEDIAPGASASLPLYLWPGKYVLICNKPGHYAAGMRTGFIAASYVGVTLKETSITLDRSGVPAGPVVFSVTNAGAVDHELVVLKTDVAADKIPARVGDPSKVSETGSVGEVEDVIAGRFSGGLLTLDAGNYVLICNKPGHYAAGMRVALTVTPSTVNVTLNEMTIQLDQPSLPASLVRFAITNAGTVLHELVVLKTDVAEDKIPANPAKPGQVRETGSVGEAEDIAPGASSRLDLTLSAGHYVLICNKPGHYAAGMHATLTVQ